MVKNLAQNYSHNMYKLLIICYLFLSLVSCGNKSNKDVDVSSVKFNYKSIRFDRELFACDTLQIMNEINKLGKKYADFAAVYFNDITGFAAKGDSIIFKNSVIDFISHKDYKGMMDTVNLKFNNTKELDSKLNGLLKHLKYYYPKQAIGDVYYFVSGLNRWSAITVDSNIGVGLDMHLGKSYPYYESVQIPNYQLLRCEPEYIPINVAKAIFEDKYTSIPEGKSLLELMIDKGKQLVFAEYLLPQESDEKLIGYTEAQLKWCKENESMIWHYFTSQKLLYSTQWQQILQYVNDGPNSTGMPPESPGNIGSWIGWQMVRRYLKNNPTIVWTKVMDNKSDGLTFLRQSGYKP
jgi:hypothetical protein